MKTRIWNLLIILAALLLFVPPAFVSAANPIIEAYPNPTYVRAFVDGDPSEWDLTNDFFANMYLAANPAKPVLSKLYVRYDCRAGTLYVLVLAEPGHLIDVDSGTGNHFVKLGNTNKLVDAAAGNDGTPPDFAYINLSGDGATADGWEASAYLAPGFYSPSNTPSDGLNVHTNVDDGDTSAVSGRQIDLYIICGPQAVTLASFSAAPAGNAIRLEWTTATELENMGFNLYRATSPAGPQVKLNDSLIASQAPGSALGASYEFVDASVQPGVTYYYWLEDVDVYGVTTLHGPVQAELKAVRRLMPLRPRFGPKFPVLIRQ
ncbi:MAG: hypothetical protein ACUVWZ_11800 [Anaerolineae bacterium]